ncbi:MAG: arginine N-succinyltransferase [Vitreimonas sp.]
MNGPTYVMRAAGPGDLEGLRQLRAIAGAGFTSLMLDDAAMAKRLELSQESFAARTITAGKERYFIALEHIESGELAGCCGVKATIGETPPFFNFRLITEAQSSAIAGKRFDMRVLIGVNDFTGCTEVGSLFVRPEHRARGVGRALAQSRYMLMKTAPQRFHEQVVSELRGVVSPEGVSPFWEALGRHFFQMDFSEADRLSAATDNQFILDLTPQHPIYVDLLPKEARDAIGKCHQDGEGARKLLEWEGFSFSNVVDIFDGGPLVSAQRDHIRTLRESKRVRVAPAAGEGGSRALIATPRINAFRCVSARASVANGVASVDAATLAALNLQAGDEALLWVDNAV